MLDAILNNPVVQFLGRWEVMGIMFLVLVGLIVFFIIMRNRQDDDD